MKYEFKGTKGKWSLEQSFFYKTDKVVWSDHKAICRITIDDKDSMANALLISKSKELLEMLINIKDYLGSDKREDVEKLIKQATEI